ncbi:hypothetical protein [Coprobacter secundus]|nr:hypothetical protein [Coprobacter secundus]
MGGYWGKQQEIETVRTVGIWYQKAVTGVYVMENGRWRLSALAFTKTLGE